MTHYCAKAENWAQPAQQRSCSALCDYGCPVFVLLLLITGFPKSRWEISQEGGNQRKRVVKSRNKTKLKRKNCQAQIKLKRSRSPLNKQNKNNPPPKIILLGFVYSLCNSTERSGTGPQENLATSKHFSRLGGHSATAGSRKGSSPPGSRGRGPSSHHLCAGPSTGAQSSPALPQRAL